MGMQVVILHKGNQRYVRQIVRHNQRRCKNNHIVLVGDDSNKSFSKYFLHWNELKISLFEKFKSNYKHLSLNDFEYELRCFERYFILYGYLKNRNMKECIQRGLDTEGVLPGPLNLRRKAADYFIQAGGYKEALRDRGLLFAYALAVSEENASGHTIVTAPTCGACGVLPAVLYHLQKNRGFSDMRIFRALATAGLIGNIVKTNASISGAEVGCQGEVGVACAMASGAATQLLGGSPAQIEYAAEMGLEHHLGMTCDPVCGLVQIPCIERNAYAAARALDSHLYASFSDGIHRVSFDKVVEVMKQTGHDLPSLYKETGEGGLAKDYTQTD